MTLCRGPGSRPSWERYQDWRGRGQRKSWFAGPLELLSEGRPYLVDLELVLTVANPVPAAGDSRVSRLRASSKVLTFASSQPWQAESNSAPTHHPTHPKTNC